LLEFYEDKRLGMPRAASHPPSKPVHPRKTGARRRIVCVAGEFAL